MTKCTNTVHFRQSFVKGGFIHATRKREHYKIIISLGTLGYLITMTYERQTVMLSTCGRLF